MALEEAGTSSAATSPAPAAVLTEKSVAELCSGWVQAHHLKDDKEMSIELGAADVAVKKHRETLR